MMTEDDKFSERNTSYDHTFHMDCPGDKSRPVL
jgi:hypothetical protein